MLVLDLHRFDRADGRERQVHVGRALRLDGDGALRRRVPVGLDLQVVRAARRPHVDEAPGDERDGLAVERGARTVGRDAKTEGAEVAARLRELRPGARELVGLRPAVVGEEAHEVLLGVDPLSRVGEGDREVQEDARVREELVGLEERIPRGHVVALARLRHAPAERRARLLARVLVRAAPLRKREERHRDRRREQEPPEHQRDQYRGSETIWGSVVERRGGGCGAHVRLPGRAALAGARGGGPASGTSVLDAR